MNLVDFLNAVNGEPWTEERHCWALVVEIQRLFFDRTLPLADYARSPVERHALIHSSREIDRWQQACRPTHGAVVLMSSRAERRVDHHAGVCILMPHPLIAHTDKPQGVAVEDLSAVRTRGWHPTFWVPA